MKRLILISLSLLFSLSSFAQFNFENLNQAELDSMSNEIAANFSHTTVTPGSSMGNIFGFQIGVMAGGTSSAELERLAKEQDPNSDLARIPHAGLMAVLSTPFGLTFEGTYLPSLGSDNADLDNMSAAIKWSFLDLGVFDLATRLHYASGGLSYTDTISSVASEVNIDHSSLGVQLLASGNLFIFKPYVGVGYISQDTDWSVNTSAPLFDFTSNSSASASGSSAQFLAGAEINLVLIRLGLEYSNMLDTDRISAKFAIGF